MTWFFVILFLAGIVACLYFMFREPEGGYRTPMSDALESQLFIMDRQRARECKQKIIDRIKRRGKYKPSRG